jgi:hypothetical protein
MTDSVDRILRVFLPHETDGRANLRVISENFRDCEKLRATARSFGRLLGTERQRMSNVEWWYKVGVARKVLQGGIGDG